MSDDAFEEPPGRRYVHSEQFEQDIRTLLHRTAFLLSRSDQTMTTLDQLDAAIDADTTQEATLTGAVGTLATAVTAVDNDVNALLAKIAANPGAPASDFTAELEKISANTAANATSVTAIQAAILGAQQADTVANPPAAAVAGGATAGPASPAPATAPVAPTIAQGNQEAFAPGNTAETPSA